MDVNSGKFVNDEEFKKAKAEAKPPTKAQAKAAKVLLTQMTNEAMVTAKDLVGAGTHIPPELWPSFAEGERLDFKGCAFAVVSTSSDGQLVLQFSGVTRNYLRHAQKRMKQMAAQAPESGDGG
jgi:hypothetical protein